MFGAGFDTGTWNDIEGAYYTSYGSGEALWLYVSIAMCVVALIAGHLHEGHSYRNAERNNKL